MKSKVCKVLAVAMIMSVFAVPSSVFAATPAFADASKNKIEAPSIVKAKKAFNIKLVGHRSSVLKGTVEDETKYVGYNYTVYDKDQYPVAVSGNYIYDENSLPKSLGLTLDKPGKYSIKCEYMLYEWWRATTWYPVNTTNTTKTKTIQVQGKTKFKVTKGGKFKAKQTKSKWQNQKSKIGKLPKVKASKGYKLKGWYTKKKGGKKVTKNTKVNFAGKTTKTYYAQFKKVK